MLFTKLFQSRIVFGKKDSCLYYVMLSYINVLGIEGPNYLIFYKIKQACDVFSCLPTLTILFFLNTFSLLVIIKAPVHNKLVFLCSM